MLQIHCRIYICRQSRRRQNHQYSVMTRRQKDMLQTRLQSKQARLTWEEKMERISPAFSLRQRQRRDFLILLEAFFLVFSSPSFTYTISRSQEVIARSSWSAQNEFPSKREIITRYWWGCLTRNHGWLESRSSSTSLMLLRAQLLVS